MVKAIACRAWIVGVHSLVVLGLCVAVVKAQSGTVAAKEASASAPAGQTKGPVAQVEQPNHDFGKIWVGTQLEHTFVIQNVGDEPLQIIQVKTSCGCTTAGNYPKTIAPGQSGEFPFRVNGDKYVGRFRVSVSIQTNDPAHASMTLTLAGFVQHYVMAAPRSAYFGNLKEDSEATKTLVLSSQVDEPIKPTLVDDGMVPSKTFKAEIKEVDPGKKYELIVHASPPYNEGYNRRVLVIDTGLPGKPKMRIYCTAVLPKRLELMPDRIYIRSNETSKVKTVTFSNKGDTPVKILEAQALDKTIDVKCVPLVPTTQAKTDAPATRYRIVATFPDGYEPPRTGTAIILKTDDAEKPLLRIPIIKSMARVQPSAVAAKRPTTPVKRPAELMLGQPVPDLSIKTQQGAEIKLGGASKTVRVVTFYASWCGYCKRAMPLLEKVYQQYKDKGVEMVLVNIDQRAGRAARTAEQSLAAYKDLGLTMPLVLDPEYTVGEPFKMKGTGVPTFFLVGKKGEIEAVHVGYSAVLGDKSPLAGELDLLLQGKTRAEFPVVGAAAAARATPTSRPAS